MAAQAALSNPVTYRAINMIASAVQQVTWFVEDDPNYAGPRVPNIEDRRRSISEVLASPNDEMTPAMMRYWLALGFAAYGRSALRVTVSPIREGCPSGLFPLQIDSLAAKYTQRGVPKLYEYGTGEDKQTFLSRQEWDGSNRAGFVDQIWRPGLSGCGRDLAMQSNTPLQSLGMPTQVIQYLILRALNSARGTPNVRYIVTTDGNLTAQQQQALKRKLNEDHAVDGDLSGNVAVLTNAGKIEVTKVSGDMSDIHSKLPADDMSRMVFSAFGIPLALAGIGASDASKFAGNFSESRLSFWEDTIIPGYIEPFVQGLTAMLCPPGLIIKADYDSVPAVQHGRAATMKAIAGVGFLTTDEKREMFGFGPSPRGFVERPVAVPSGEGNV